MKYEGSLLKVNGKHIPKLLTYKIQYNKLWSDDSGRNLSGENKGTLIGIFPKLLLEFGSMTDDEMVEFLKWTDLAEITVEWYDPKIKGTRTASYYSNNVEVSLKSQITMKYEKVSVNLIPNKKRG